MGIAEDFLNAFFAAHPHEKSGNLSMKELQALMAEFQKKVNNDGLEDFDGLSPEQMGSLLYSPFKPGSIIHFREGLDAHVNDAPFFLSAFRTITARNKTSRQCQADKKRESAGRYL